MILRLRIKTRRWSGLPRNLVSTWTLQREGKAEEQIRGKWQKMMQERQKAGEKCVCEHGMGLRVWVCVCVPVWVHMLICAQGLDQLLMLLKMEGAMNYGIQVVSRGWETGFHFVSSRSFIYQHFQRWKWTVAQKIQKGAQSLITLRFSPIRLKLPSDLRTLTGNLLLSLWLVMVVSDPSTLLTQRIGKSLRNIGNLLDLKTCTPFTSGISLLFYILEKILPGHTEHIPWCL